MASQEINYWLMKSEPDAYSIDTLKKDGVTLWDGIRNYQARNFMRKMAVGDKVFITLPVSGSDHGDKKIETIYNGEFLVTQLRHVLQTEDRRHSFVMNVNKDSTSETFRNQSTAKEPVGKKGSVTIL